ncbi:MAG: amidohydrolase [Fibrobacteres bacterium]|nr:amidohydrolase [Fibrobacterota bacterium]
MDKELLEKLKKEIEKVLPDVKSFRHRLHEEPEVALAEHLTQQKILKFIDTLPLDLHKPYIGTDVVADLSGKTDRMVVLRADIDALPMTEETGADYSSKIKGMMHACGHDGHTAILAGTARVLSALQKELPVSVRFVFQPGEERVAAGKKLVAAGALGNAEAAFALHGWPGLPVSAIQSRSGVFYAAGSSFAVDIIGKGCHGAKPENGINPIPMAGKLVHELYKIHQREHSKDGSVITVCVVNSGTLSNIIPDKARIAGTVRFLEEARGDVLEKMIRDAAAEAVAGTGATAVVEYTNFYDMPVINSEDGYQRIKKAVASVLPSGSFVEAEAPTMGNEDFAFYLKGRKGAMMGLGQGKDRAVLHNAHYDFNDDTIATGILMFCTLILEY